MKSVLQIEAIVSDVDELIERAKLILGAAPYFTYVPEEQYVRLSIQDGEAILVWPESHSGYYDSCSIEEQSKGFAVELLLMSQPEIAAWSAEQKRIYDEQQRIARDYQTKINAERQRQSDIARLAELKAKYE